MNVYQGNYLYGYKCICSGLCYVWTEMPILFLTWCRRKMLGHCLVTYFTELTCSAGWSACFLVQLAELWPTHLLVPAKLFTWCNTKFFLIAQWLAVVELTVLHVGSSVLQKPHWVGVIWISLDNWLPQLFQIDVILDMAGKLEFTQSFYVRR